MFSLFTSGLQIAGRVISAGAKWLSHRGRWIWAAGAMTALLVAILAIRLHNSLNQAEALTESLRASQGEVQLLRQARAADAEALASRDARRTIIITKEAQGRAATEKAIAANPEWASVPVPRDVADSLQQ